MKTKRGRLAVILLLALCAALAGCNDPESDRSGKEDGMGTTCPNPGAAADQFTSDEGLHAEAAGTAYAGGGGNCTPNIWANAEAEHQIYVDLYDAPTGIKQGGYFLTVLDAGLGSHEVNTEASFTVYESDGSTRFCQAFDGQIVVTQTSTAEGGVVAGTFSGITNFGCQGGMEEPPELSGSFRATREPPPF